jgi:RsiW-degrading membrane proteinase PrsW (M82 family)
MLPLPVVLAAFLWLDRYSNEPVPMLMLAFGWGATVSVLISLVLNTTGSLLIVLAGGSPDAGAVVVAPVVEEFAKGAGLVVVLIVLRDRFDGILDGLVYAGFIGAGFAYVENILYFGRELATGGVAALGAVFVVRAIMSPFAHPMFTAATGIGVGAAIGASATRVRVLAPMAGLAVAVMLHALWNFGASLLIFSYLLIQAPIFVGFVAFGVYVRRREGDLIRRHLTTYAHCGWLTGADVAMLASLRGRRLARDWAAQVHGSDGLAAMKDYQDHASRLAFLREKMERDTAGPDAPTQEHGLLNAIWQSRTRFVG